MSEVNNPGTVNELKTMGILPKSENTSDYPEIGSNEQWDQLHEHPTVKAKAEIIATLIKAGKPKLATAYSKVK